MVRAQETGSIIGEKFPELPRDHCSLLQEGAPYPPEPSSKAWTPDRSVRNDIIGSIDLLFTHFATYLFLVKSFFIHPCKAYKLYFGSTRRHRQFERIE